MHGEIRLRTLNNLMFHRGLRITWNNADQEWNVESFVWLYSDEIGEEGPSRVIAMFRNRELWPTLRYMFDEFEYRARDGWEPNLKTGGEL